VATAAGFPASIFLFITSMPIGIAVGVLVSQRLGVDRIKVAKGITASTMLDSIF